MNSIFQVKGRLYEKNSSLGVADSPNSHYKISELTSQLNKEHFTGSEIL